jgi:hypothetical protein
MAAPNGSCFSAGKVGLDDIDSVVSARLEPARVTGNAQPAAFNRQVAVYLAKHVGGWITVKTVSSTTAGIILRSAIPSAGSKPGGNRIRR